MGEQSRQGAPTTAWLHCPLCGASKHLRNADDLPANITHIFSPCPACYEKTTTLDVATHEHDKRINNERGAYRTH